MNPCRHCGAEASGLWLLPDGCWRFADPVQLLCPQHEARLDDTPARLLIDLVPARVDRIGVAS